MVQNLNELDLFVDLSLYVQARKLFGQQIASFEERGAIFYGEVILAGRVVKIVFTNGKLHGGTFGYEESHQLLRIIKDSRTANIPIVFFLDSGGARLNQGFRALGAFREMYRELLKTRLQGVPMISVILRNCFGGASMIAATCSYRISSAHSRYGMSGPKLIFGHDLLIKDTQRGGNLISDNFGGKARFKMGAFDDLCEDNPVAYKILLESFLGTHYQFDIDLKVFHEILKKRLLHHLPKHKTHDNHHNILFGDGCPVGAVESLLLADHLLSAQAGEKFTICLDSPSHAMTLFDEALVLSDYMSHLALCLAQTKKRNITVELDIKNQAGGGVYVSLASGCDRVRSHKNTKFSLLPNKAVSAILGKDVRIQKSSDELLEYKVIDKFIAK